MKEKNKEIEALRAIAILFVLLHHSSILIKNPSPELHLAGSSIGFWTGVDLFFVISGFLITTSLLPLYDIKTCSKTFLKQYAIKRAFRILPAAWVWILLPILLIALIPHAQHVTPIQKLANDGAAAFLNIANAHYANCFTKASIEKACSTPPIIGHYWSLSLEEQFYLLIPLLMVMRKKFLTISACLLLITLGLTSERAVFSYGYFFRMDGLAWGALLAHAPKGMIKKTVGSKFFEHATVRHGFFLAFLLIIPLMAACGGASLFSISPPWGPAISIAALCSALLVLFAAENNNLLLKEGKPRSILVMIGERSYSLYLAHLPIFYYSSAAVSTQDIAGVSADLLSAALAIPISILASEATYRWIEQPFRQYGRAIASQMA